MNAVAFLIERYCCCEISHRQAFLGPPCNDLQQSAVLMLKVSTAGEKCAVTHIT